MNVTARALSPCVICWIMFSHMNKHTDRKSIHHIHTHTPINKHTSTQTHQQTHKYTSTQVHKCTLIIAGVMLGMRPRTAYSALSRCGFMVGRVSVFVCALHVVGCDMLAHTDVAVENRKVCVQECVRNAEEGRGNEKMKKKESLFFF